MSSKPSQILYSFFLTCLLFFILTSITNAQTTVCNTTSNYTQGSQYKSNLNHTLTTLASNIPPNGFYATFSGAGPNRVYGLLQCRGDVSYQVCRICANTSTMDILQVCPNNKEAVMIYDFCKLQYAGHPISSKPNLEIVVNYHNVQNTTTPVLFNKVLQELMSNLSSKAASVPSKFAIGRASFGDRGNLYGLAQCNRDLSETDCLRCLQAMYEFRSNTTSFQKSIGAQIWSRTCNIRYENYVFYESSTNAPSPAPPGVVDGNPSTRTNSTSSNHGGKKSNTKNVIIIVVSAVLASLLLFSICICCLWTKIIKGRNDVKEDAVKNTGSEIAEDSESLVFDLATLKLATNNFSEKFKLGEGGFGGVYKGELSDGREIAVKRLDRYSGQGLKEMKTEVVLVAKLMHRNLVKLLGFCIEEVEKLLVYEYLQNGSLDKMLFDQRKCLLLDWDKRFNVIIGIARGLLYLHQDSQVRIVHRDLKASNILLDDDMNAKISDFGLARLFCESQAEENTNRIAGTYGYMAPEYTIQGQYSTKSDVFSFGVLVLEIVSGRKNSSFSDSNLPTFAWQHWNQGAALEIVDPKLGQQWVPSEIIKCVQLGLLCVQQEPADRPSMAEVFLWLNSNSVTCPVPAQPAYFMEGITTDSDITKENTWLTESEKSDMKSPQPSVNYVTVTDIHPR